MHTRYTLVYQKGNACTQVSRKFPLRHGCIWSYVVSTQGIICMPAFTVEFLQPQTSVIKSHV